MKKDTLRIFNSFSEYFSLFVKTFKKMMGLRKVPPTEKISPQFREKLMLVVSQVNKCAYCSFLHAKKALEEGIPQKAIDNMLNFDGEHYTKDELPAVLFAQHFAETKGNPSQKAVDTLTSKYGEHKSQQIHAFTYSVLLGNLCCNTVVSFKEKMLAPSERRKLFLTYIFCIPVAHMIKNNSEKK